MASRPASARKLANLFSYVPSLHPASKLAISQTKRIMAMGRNGYVDKAFELFEQMPKKTQVSWNAMLSVLVDSGRLDSAVQLFDDMPNKNPTSYTSMIAGLSKAGLVSQARCLFDSIDPVEHNVFSWTAMISCYAHNNESIQALKLFVELYDDFFALRMIPNSHTFSILLKSCGSIKCLPIAKQIQSLVVKVIDEESESSIFLLNSLIDVNAKMGNLVDAERMFRRMKWKDLASWNTMMDGYARHLLIDEALSMFSCMREKDALSWNIIMSGLVDCHRGEEALRLFILFLRSVAETMPNSSTYTIVLNACATLVMLEFGRQIHACVVKNGLYHSNVFVCNSLITAYASCGLTEELEQVFNEMLRRDVITWNSVIQGLGQNGCSEKSLEIADKALDFKNFNPNTFIAILTSCSHGGLVDEGSKYFDSLNAKYGLSPSLGHYICMIDMLGRAGKIESACDLLHQMPFKANSVAWETLLNACLIHSNVNIGETAARELQLLEPGNVKGYLALANIYNKTGRVEDSRKVLDSIRQKHSRKEVGSSWVIH